MEKPEGDIDPKSLDVVQKRRRRRTRAAPAPPEHLAAGKPAALKRALSRPLSPGIMLEPSGVSGYRTTAPHSDLELWEIQLADAFGTRSTSAMRTFVAQLKMLVSESWDEGASRWKPNERELNAALAMIAGLRPRNEAEAALAAQMVAVHWLQIRLTAQSVKWGQVDAQSAAIAGKLARTYVQQLEAFNRLQGKRQPPTRQTIKVTKVLRQEVHYHDHRGGVKVDGQSHERTNPRGPEIADECTALPSPHSGGEVVPLPSRKRQG
jgi:hypothetical protein